jgi:hypothetical protein
LADKPNRYDDAMRRLGVRAAPGYKETRQVDITGLEEMLDVRLPEDYRHFVEKYGATELSGKAIFANPADPGKPSAIITSFTSVSPTRGLALSRMWQIQVERGNISPDFLPITGSALPKFGLIGLGLRGDKRGQIFLWRFPNGEQISKFARQPSESNAEFIASDFDSFINGLKLQ